MYKLDEIKPRVSFFKSFKEIVSVGGEQTNYFKEIFFEILREKKENEKRNKPSADNVLHIIKDHKNRLGKQKNRDNIINAKILALEVKRDVMNIRKKDKPWVLENKVGEIRKKNQQINDLLETT